MKRWGGRLIARKIVKGILASRTFLPVLPQDFINLLAHFAMLI
jgi:hypothetical protein